MLDVVSPLRDGIAYALRTLLRPLGIVPVLRDRLPEDGPALHYAAHEGTAPSRIARLHRAPDVETFFTASTLRRARDVEWAEWDGERWPVLFGDPRRPDLAASAFYWLSGWHEHHGAERDEHGRFPVGASLQAALGVLRRPPVDAYRERLAAHLAAAGVPVRRRHWAGHTWALCPTVDVDYVRKWRPGIVYRELIEHFALNRRRVTPRERLRRLAATLRDVALRPDPYRSALDRMPREVAARGGTATFFFKAGAYGPRDVAYRLEARALRRRAARLQTAGHEIGLHPGYGTHDRLDRLIAERDRLAAWCGSPPAAVRQHYLCWDPSVTPGLHDQAGFRIDSTIGFATDVGFRRGTCLPFRLYDSAAWRTLPVWEMPLAFMDGALFVRLGLTADEAEHAVSELLGTCRRYGGAAVGLWHNVLWDEEDYPGWGRHFTRILDRARREGAYIGGIHAALRNWLASAP